MTATKGGYATTTHNIMLILRYDLRWKDVICYDDFAQRVVFLKPPPIAEEFREHDISARHDPHAHTTRNVKAFLGEEVNDTHMTNIAAWIEREYKPMKPASSHVQEAIEAIARTNKRHPVRDMIAKEVWDGVERIGRSVESEEDRGAVSWLTTFFGAEDNDYVRKIGRWWLISAVARVMAPGCQADYALILEGNQGAGKSAGLRALSEPWFSEDLGDVNHIKESQQQLAGVWIAEIAELDALNRASDGTIKKFLSQPYDRYRPPYGRRPRNFPRQCVFAGTTNKRSYLRDVTGNRRYWPCWTTHADVDGIRENRAQLWAEALVLYNAGKLWWPQPGDTVVLTEHQEDRMEQDPWFGPVSNWIDKQDQLGKPHVTIANVLAEALNIELARWTPIDEKRVSKILQQLGRVRVRRVLKGGARLYVYEKPGVIVDAQDVPYPPIPTGPLAPPAPPRPKQGLFGFETDAPYGMDTDDPYTLK